MRLVTFHCNLFHILKVYKAKRKTTKKNTVIGSLNHAPFYIINAWVSTERVMDLKMKTTYKKDHQNEGNIRSLLTQKNGTIFMSPRRISYRVVTWSKKTGVEFLVLARGNFFISSETLFLWLYFEPRLKIFGCPLHG